MKISKENLIKIKNNGIKRKLIGVKIDIDKMKTDISQIKNDIRVKTIKDMVEPKVDTTKTEEYQGGWRLW